MAQFNNDVRIENDDMYKVDYYLSYENQNILKETLGWTLPDSSYIESTFDANGDLKINVIYVINISMELEPDGHNLLDYAYYKLDYSKSISIR